LHCCTECFWDVDLKKTIQRESSEEGDCAFCGSHALTIDPTKLKEKFEFVKENLFEEIEEGDSLASCFQAQFEVFNTNKITDTTHLLRAIFSDDPSYIQGNFKLKFDNLRLSQEWDELGEELISRNRFFPKTERLTELFRSANPEDFKVFEPLMSQLKRLIPINYPLYRARVTSNVTNLRKDLDKPPANKASDGRANPHGISYLYCSNDKETAVTEVKPSTGSIVHVAKMHTIRPVPVLDLTQPRRCFSPFPFADNETELALEFIVLLEKLSDELSIPIAESRRLKYLPTQFFCEFIKSRGFVEGILFTSSFTKKENFVFFCSSSSDLVEFKGFEKLQVTKTKHEYDQI